MAIKSGKTSIRYGSSKMAADVKIDCILDYLCDVGPSFCCRCPSQCAYGKRYLNEYLSCTREKHVPTESHN